MTVVKSNTFEGGTAGTQISTGNSGGTSGDAFDSVVAGIAGMPKFSTTQTHGGSRSMEIAQGASFTNGAGYGTWNFSAEPRLYIRVYVWFPPGASSIDTQIAAVGGLMLASYATSSSTGLHWYTGGGSGIGGAGSAGAGPKSGAWFRCEAMIDFPNNLVQSRLFVSTIESDIPTSDSGANTVIATSVSTINSISIGCMTGFNVPPGPFQNSSMFLDDIGISSVNWLGPSGAVSRALPISGGGKHDLVASSGSKCSVGVVSAQDGRHDLVATYASRRTAVPLGLSGRALSERPYEARRAMVVANQPPAKTVVGGGISLYNKVS